MQSIIIRCQHRVSTSNCQASDCLPFYYLPASLIINIVKISSLHANAHPTNPPIRQPTTTTKLNPPNPSGWQCLSSVSKLTGTAVYFVTNSSTMNPTTAQIHRSTRFSRRMHNVPRFVNSCPKNPMLKIKRTRYNNIRSKKEQPPLRNRASPMHFSGADPGRLPQSSGRRSEMRKRFYKLHCTYRVKIKQQQKFKR